MALAQSLILKWLRRGVNAVLEFLVPTYCPVCHRKLFDDERIVCEDCIADIARTEHAVLEQNGVDLLLLEAIHKSRRTVHFERGAAFAFYNSGRGHVLRTLIERGKYGMHPDAQIFYLLGRLAAQEYVDSDLMDNIDCLVPVPLHPRRLRERGFNQAEYICRGMSEVLHIPIDNEHLYRKRNNAHQSQSEFENRQSNVQDLFAMRNPEEWKGKHIMLVDDVITSGATLLACMQQITPIRACRISVFALGWAHN